MVRVLDACALMVYLEKEQGYEHVKELFIEAAENDKKLLMSTVNWGEVYYILVKEYGRNQTEKIMTLVKTFPIEIVLADIELTKQAAIYKAEKKLPYADCFAAALTKLHKIELITSDSDFKVMEGEIRILWITKQGTETKNSSPSSL